jgi:hypothetical protein
MRGAAGTNVTIAQSEAQWLDLLGFEDVIVWMQCQEVTGSGATVQLNYQTAPTKDEALFVSSATINLAASATPVITKVLLSAATQPLARWLRWQLLASGTSTSAWDAMFRVYVAANIGPHPLRPRINPPSLRPNGKSCNGDCQKGGSPPLAGMTMGQKVAARNAAKNKMMGGAGTTPRVTVAGTPSTSYGSGPTTGGSPSHG